jgi:hypothetical protein
MEKVNNSMLTYLEGDVSPWIDWSYLPVELFDCLLGLFSFVWFAGNFSVEACFLLFFEPESSL